jgi:hypothetical protein
VALIARQVQLNNLQLRRGVKYRQATSVSSLQEYRCASRFTGRENLHWNKATNCDERAGTQGWRTSLAIMQQEKGAIMKLATLALTTALVFTGTYALAQSTGGSASGSSATGGAATGSTTTGSSTTGTTTGNATGTNPGTGMTNNAGSAAAGQNSALNPSGNTLLNPSPSGSTVTPATPGSTPGR